MSTEKKRAGMVVLVGRSNAGKSTLLNALVGTKVAITSPKPQTTRHVIQGVIHDPRAQIVIADTPGIFTRVPDRLTAALNEKAREAVAGIDALLYVVDPTRHVGDEEQAVHRLVKSVTKPKILVLNKSDLERPYRDEYLAWSDEFVAVVDVSAERGMNLKTLVSLITDLMPEGEPLYPHGQLTDADNKFWLSELIREKVFLKMHQEVPYTVTVEIEEAEMRPNGVFYLKAAIVTTASRYRKMLIGTGADKVRAIGTAVRKELEAVSGGKAYVELEVRVDERWQERFE